MQVLTYREPSFVGSPNIREPNPVPFNLAQSAAFRRGDVIVRSTTGSIVVPPGSGTSTLANIAGPTLAVTTLGTTASSGAPAATYFGQVTYFDSTGPKESLTGPLFEINCPPGFLPTVSVAAAGEPSGISHFRTYLGLVPGYLALQTTASAGTATGSTFTAANPLTNYAGANRGTTGVSTGILGIAQHASNENYYDGYGGSFTAGNPGSRLGSTNTIGPLTPTESPLAYIVTLDNGTLFEFSLNSASGGYSDLLVGNACGLTLDATTGWFTADTTQTACATIIGHRDGVYIGPTQQGGPGDVGARVILEFYPTALGA